LVDKKLASQLATKYVGEFTKTIKDLPQEQIITLLEVEQAKIRDHKSDLSKVFGGRREGLTSRMSEAEMCVQCHQDFFKWMRFELLADRHGPVVHALSKIANSEGVAIT
jgi:hypothetical protein